MFRKKAAGKKKEDKDSIRWRGHEVTRIEAFSDAVFAFAITLLVVSLEVPHNFHELMVKMLGFFPFAICFTLLFQVWMAQNLFFRRYGLHDEWTIVFNGMLLFVVLFFVYPLKFLYNLFLLKNVSIDLNEIVYLYYIYSGGFAAIYLLFTLMYLNAYKRRDYIDLTPSEVFETRTYIYRNLCMMTVGLLSMIIISFGARNAAWAGMVYMLIGPAVAITHRRRGRIHRRKFEEPVLDKDKTETKKEEEMPLEN